jgi:hypothetical protein
MALTCRPDTCWPLSIRSSGLTLMGVTEYSGNEAARARAPASFVHSLSPTKNSRPVYVGIKIIEQCDKDLGHILPVKRTSPPSRCADSSEISTTGSPNSFFKTARIVSTCGRGLQMVKI